MNHFPTRVLLAIDGSEDAALALHAALDLSTRTGSELHVVHAWQAFPSYSHPSIAMATDVASYEREAQKVLFEQLDKIEASGVKAAGAHLERGRPAETITAMAQDVGADLIVIGSRGLGPVQRLVMGSVSEGVVDLAACPVLVVRGGDTAWPPGRVIVGEDSSSNAKKAGDLAAAVARVFGAQMLLVRAYPTFPEISEEVAFLEEARTLDAAMVRHELALMDRASQLEEEHGERPRVRVREGDAAHIILQSVEEGEEPTLIAVGRRGLGLLDRIRLGSVSTKVLRAATGPVLVCPS